MDVAKVTSVGDVLGGLNPAVGDTRLVTMVTKFLEDDAIHFQLMVYVST